MLQKGSGCSLLGVLLLNVWVFTSIGSLLLLIVTKMALWLIETSSECLMSHFCDGWYISDGCMV